MLGGGMLSTNLIQHDISTLCPFINGTAFPKNCHFTCSSRRAFMYRMERISGGIWGGASLLYFAAPPCLASSTSKQASCVPIARNPGARLPKPRAVFRILVSNKQRFVPAGDDGV